LSRIVSVKKTVAHVYIDTSTATAKVIAVAHSTTPFS